MTKVMDKLAKLDGKPFQHEARLFFEKRTKNQVSQSELSTDLGFKCGQFISNVERGLCGLPLDKWAFLIKRGFATHDEVLKAKNEDLKAKLMKYSI